MTKQEKEAAEIARREALTPEERAEEDRVKAEEDEKKKSKKEDMVEIKRSDFDRIMATMEKQSKDIELLYKTTDKNRMAKELNKAGEKLIKQCKVRLWDNSDKMVIGWKLITNRCEVVQGRWVEDQTANVVLDDGTVETVPLIEFYRKTLNKVDADIISRTTELDEKNQESIIFKLQFSNGKTLLLNSVYVN